MNWTRRFVMKEGEGGGAGGAPAAGGAPPAAGASGASGAAAPAEWTAALPENLKGYVTNKGFKDPSSVVDAYQNLEKLIGVPKDRLIKIPEKEDDSAAWSDIFNRLGRPEKPEGYQLTVPEGQSKDFADWASKTFHKLGISRKQGEALVNEWNGLQKTTNDGATTARQSVEQAQREAVKKEWGAAYDENLKIMEHGAQKFGLDKTAVEKLGQSLGIDKTAKLLYQIGVQLGEDKFVSGSGSGKPFGPLAPQAARDKITQLKGDTDFVARYMKGDLSAREEMEKLHLWANPPQEG